MRRHYLLTVAREEGNHTRPRMRANWGQPRHTVTGPFQVIIYTPDGWPSPGLSLEQNDNQVRLIEGELLPGGATSQPIRPGLYNEITIDGRSGGATVRNDAYAVLPCYFWTDRDRLVISNSLTLIADFSGATVDELGLAQQYMVGAQIGARTLFQGVWLAMPGRAYHFDLHAHMRLSVWRHSRMWTAVNDSSLDDAISRFRDLWEQALDRSPGRLNAPVGVMLSGGLDSRLVAGGIASRGVPIVCLTHGNAESDETELARQVSETLGARFVTNPLDQSFEFGRLALPHLHHFVEMLYNPIWDSSAALLFSRGVHHFATGVGLDDLIGGYRNKNRRRRLADNLRLSLTGRLKVAPAAEEDIELVAGYFGHQYEKRAHYYAPLLVEPYRSIVLDNVPVMKRGVLERVRNYAADGPVTRQQLHERFVFEHRFRQLAMVQERVLLHYGSLVAPSLDPDLGTFLTNLTPALRTDHFLYYRVMRRLYPALARIPVQSLGGPIDRPQTLVELARLARIASRTRLSTWINFEPWVKSGDNMERYERLFLSATHFFDAEAVTALFDNVRAGHLRLYDGNETMNFLELAWQVRPHVAPAPAAARVAGPFGVKVRQASMAYASD